MLLVAAAWPFDIRLLYLAVAVGFAGLLARRFPDGPERRIALLVALCNPLLLPYLVVGRNEILLLLPLVVFCNSVTDGRWRAAAWALGAALAFKQFAVAAVPFFVIARREKWREIWPVLALPLVTCLPFLVWDPRAFVEGTLVWNLGGGADAYPIKWLGWGLSPLAYGLDLVERRAVANPFGWVALPAQLLVLGLLGRRLWRDPSPPQLIFSSGVMLFVMLFTARAFAFNYLVVPALLVPWRRWPGAR